MKTWLNYFLPEDEYKERQMLIFLAEAAVLQVILILILMMTSQFIVPLAATLMLSICLFSIILYVGIRYIFSGIEYTNVCTEQQYKHEIKLLRKKSFSFMAIYLLLAVVFQFIGSASFFDTKESRFDFFVILAISGLFLFATQYISLRMSYEKNKNLV